jgi:C1A family cysteine protease
MLVAAQRWMKQGAKTMSEIRYGGMGWQRDLPDYRDYTTETDEIKEVLTESAPLKAAAKSTPDRVDLRPCCSPIEDQQSIGSCTAHAGVGLIEYYERRAFDQHIDASRLFLYKVTRNLMKVTGDTGAYLRDTMKAMVLFGVPPEEYWPYDTDRYEEEPSAFCYAFAQSYKAIRYYRHDPPGTDPVKLLKSIKKYLAAELPCMFGFSVYSSIPPIGTGDGDIPFPGKGERFVGGHAVMAVGYDDKKKVGDHAGALLIRNSWGRRWGEDGYGWLPYAYVERGLATDFWSLVKKEYVDTSLFD